jgi:hypothetical protein
MERYLAIKRKADRDAIERKTDRQGHLAQWIVRQ